MTGHRSFKCLVRTRMARTGESYTTARAVLLAAQRTETGRPPLAASDATIRRKTGRGWEEWFDLLDEWGAADQPHREIMRWVAEQVGLSPLSWDAQAVATSYERARGLRAVGQHPDGYTLTASKTVTVPVDRLFDAFVDESLRQRWLPAAPLRQRTSTRPKVARFDWTDGTTRLNVTFEPKGAAKSTAALSHERLADTSERNRMRAFWRERLAVLQYQLETGETDV